MPVLPFQAATSSRTLTCETPSSGWQQEDRVFAHLIVLTTALDLLF